jgi:hypothetical protein
MRRFAAHLTVELPAFFNFLFRPTIDATNWRAEQALRPAVVNPSIRSAPWPVLVLVSPVGAPASFREMGVHDEKNFRPAGRRHPRCRV